MDLKVLVVAASTLIGGQAIAADWLYVTDLDSEGSHLLVDKDSIVRSGQLRKAWFKWSYVVTKAKSVPSYAKFPSGSGSYIETLDLSYFNCAERTTATIQAIFRDKDGEVAGQTTLTVKEATFSEVAPETVGEAMLTLVCKHPLAAPK